jgi:hypothetical protein
VFALIKTPGGGGRSAVTGTGTGKMMKARHGIWKAVYNGSCQQKKRAQHACGEKVN